MSLVSKIGAKLVQFGAFLLKDPERVALIVQAVRKLRKG